MPQERVGDVMTDPVAVELLAAAIPARFAYDGLDGFPRVVPVGIHWNGVEVVTCSPTNAAKVKALQAHPRVAMSIDTNVPPQKVLLVRGSARVEIVDGVPDEYLAGVHKYVDNGDLDEQWFSTFEQQVRELYQHMARISITPEWAKVFDFQSRIPKAVLDIVEGRATS